MSPYEILTTPPVLHLFLDESGDLGFDFTKRGTSRVFVVTILVTREKRSIEKVVRRVHRGLRAKFRRMGGVLHAYREEDATRRRLLTGLAQKHCSIIAIVLNKRKVFTKLQDEKAVLYNYVTNILMDRLMNKHLVEPGESVTLVASQRETNKFLNENFRSYILGRVRTSHDLGIEVTIKTPSQEKALQAADSVSWAIFRKFQHDDSSYFDLIGEKVEVASLFP